MIQQKSKVTREIDLGWLNGQPLVQGKGQKMKCNDCQTEMVLIASWDYRQKFDECPKCKIRIKRQPVKGQND